MSKYGESTAVEGFVFGSIAVGILAALAVLLWQVYGFLQSGSWPALSAIDALVLCDSSWALSPSGWLGVHKILAWLPLSFTLFILGMTPFWLWSFLDDNS